MRKIIFLRHEPLTAHIVRFFSINELMEKNEVEYWDLTSICFPEMVLLSEVKAPYVRKILSLEELNKELRINSSKEIAYLVDVVFNWKTKSVYRLFSKYNNMFIHLDLFSDSILPIPKIRYFEFTFRSIIFFFKKVFYFVLLKFYVKMFNIKEFYAHFSSLSLHGKERNHYFLNHPDFDFFLRSGDSLPLVNTNYIVFLDEYFPLHPDILHLLRVDVTEEASKYNKSLNSFFTKLESTLGMKVVIAAHPKAQYNNNDFQGRTIFYGKTMELIQHAELVLAHSSSSINFAVLYKKACVFLYNNAYKSLRFAYLNAQYRSKVLQAPFLNIDDENCNINNISFNPNLDKYEKYSYYCLTSRQTERVTNSELISDYLNLLFKKGI